MAEPITVPIVTDPAEIAAIGFDAMEALVPDWNRSRGDHSSQLIASCAQMMAPARDTAADVPTAILRYLGRWVDNVLPVDATSAQTTATVTALDADGYQIEDGTRFEIRTSGDTGQIFLSVGTVTIAPGDTSTLAGEVVLVAEEKGAAGSGLPADSVVVPVDALAWVDTVTLTALTTGGIDAETDDQYIARWVLLRSLSRTTPVLAEHFAATARLLVPGIGRALGVDNYDPDLATYGHEKVVTVYTADLSGEPVSGGLMTATADLLESLRELNFQVFVRAATYTTLKVDYVAVAHPGFDPAGVKLAVDAALADYFSPATWGTPYGSDATEWRSVTTVRYKEVVAVVDRVEGLDYITTLQIALEAGALGVIDVPIPGPGALTRLGTVTGVVT